MVKVVWAAFIHIVRIWNKSAVVNAGIANGDCLGIAAGFFAQFGLCRPLDNGNANLVISKDFLPSASG
ncbi:hypothetical protein CH330_03065 [candidate division WOR-3 bacterium JGI_Cruoil_03_51_56]|uniref:Uncharacterized protein n=1 Tax=candidate division WOR-3 bacterium JGI_Cruoil_03_51_56 TaxID=1973747 RepID=A0A235BVQ0_UNCW3|nr:MAG: hypothetical protein CH330_03065 [candidate division WOR-3 bacterium JGI_Cruoil_03_51_56]